MWDVNKQNLLKLLVLLVSLLQGIRGEFGVFIEQRKISHESPLQNNFGEILNRGNEITTARISEGGNFYDTGYSRKKRFADNIEKDDLDLIAQSSRNSSNDDLLFKNQKDCVSCMTRTRSPHSAYCYQGLTLSKMKCSGSNHCFTEMHPNYIKRGCSSLERQNITFVCNCHMCNDKPYNHTASYYYTKTSDWQYDNRRLNKPRTTSIVCKVCQTTEFKLPSDALCKDGKRVDFMKCPSNHVCYTNIDYTNDYVSRGCIKMPIYNSMFIFCNGDMCNNVSYYQFKDDVLVTRTISAIKYNNIMKRKKLMSDSSVSKNCKSVIQNIAALFLSIMILKI